MHEPLTDTFSRCEFRPMCRTVRRGAQILVASLPWLACASPRVAPPTRVVDVPVAAVTPAPEEHVAPASSSAASVAPSADAGPALRNRVSRVRVLKGCQGTSARLADVQSRCACPHYPERWKSDENNCGFDETADAERMRNSLEILPLASMHAKAGATKELRYVLRNKSEEEVPILIDQDGEAELRLFDAQGVEMKPSVDPRCPAVLRMVRVSGFVLEPRGTLEMSVRLRASRQKYAMVGNADCSLHAAHALPKGAYEVEVRPPLWPNEFVRAFSVRVPLLVE